MKLALFTYSTKPRGSVIHTLELAEALHYLGHQVSIYALDKDGQGFDRPSPCSLFLIPVRSAPADLDQLIQQRIHEFVDYLSQANLNYDCYHAQDCLSANALAILVQQNRIPHFIRTVHHLEAFPSPYLQQCQERSIRAANLCLCVSQQWQTELRQHYQINAARVINGVNLWRFSPILNDAEYVLQAKWQLSGSPVYLTIGGIEPRKNSIQLLYAFRQVLDQYPAAQLVIAGGATLFDYQSYRDRFFAVAEALNLVMGRSLILPGVVADHELPALYRLADAFVFPSHTEGWGLVILEAIASGLPVITSNHLPFTEFLTPQQALLVDPDSSDSIAQAMQMVLQPDRAFTLVQNSQTILPHYTWKTSATMHVQQYQRLIKSTYSPSL